MEEGYLADEEAILASPRGQEAVRRFLDDKKLLYQATDAIDVDRFIDLLSGATPAPGRSDAYTGKSVHERLLAAPGLRLIADTSVVRNSVIRAVRARRLAVRLANGETYDGDGRVTGGEGARKRVGGDLDVFPLDDTSLMTVAGSSAAEEWLHVDSVDGGTGPVRPGAGGATPPPPPPPPGTKTADTWDSAVAVSGERPLEKLTLTADTPADAKLLAQVSGLLSANEVTLDVTVSGPLRGGGQANFAMLAVKLTHPLKPVELASNLANAIDAPSFQARAALMFSGSRSDLPAVLEQAANAAPAGIRVQAVFGPPA
jgi:hypothetical protein